MSRSEDDLERVKAHLQALSESLPALIERVKAIAAERGSQLSVPLPDPEREAHRLAGFAAYLDHYGRMDGRTLGPIDIRAVLEEAVALAGGEIAQKAGIYTDYQPVPLVYGNPRQLGQVFISLLINAAQATPPGAPETHRVSIALDTAPNGWVRVAIADTGAGISEDILPQIFEPLYSTKRGAGMGIGLAIVREIIQGAGGRISVESQPGHGTTFTIELPPTK